MIKKIIITLIVMMSLGICQNVQAQECNADFTYSINSENGLLVNFVPNDLSSIASTVWFLDGIVISFGTEVLYHFAESGSHVVCLEVITPSEDTCIRCMNICVDMAIEFDTSATSIGAASIENPKFELYPNPTLDNLVIKFKNDEIKMNTEISLKIMDVEGRVLKTILYKTKYDDNEININVADLPEGTYFINIQSDLLFESHKFVKK